MAKVLAFPVHRVRRSRSRFFADVAREEAETHATRSLVAYSALAAGALLTLLQLASLGAH